MDDIKKWLEEHGSYQEGLRLFMQYSRNRNIAHYLNRREDRVKLTYELSKIVPCLSVAAVASTPRNKPNAPGLTKPNERLKVVGNSIKFEDMPPQIKVIYTQVCDAYKKMRSLHEKMKLVESDEQRAELRKELVELDATNRDLWAIIDKWGSDGSIPEQSTDDGVSIDYKAVQSARISVHRNLASLKKATDPVRIDALKVKVSESLKVINQAGGEFKPDTISILLEFGLIDADPEKK